MAEVASPPTLEDVVAKYVALRDRKAQLEAKCKADVAEINRALDKLEVYFLNRMNAQGLEALPTAAGTAYKSVRTSVKVADWDSFLEFVREGEHWTMLERRASKSAVEEYKEANQDLPPGLDAHSEVVVNVRRG